MIYAIISIKSTCTNSEYSARLRDAVWLFEKSGGGGTGWRVYSFQFEHIFRNYSPNVLCGFWNFVLINLCRSHKRVSLKGKKIT